MFWIFEILAGKESKAEQEYERLDSFELEFRKLENYCFDNQILR